MRREEENKEELVYSCNVGQEDMEEDITIDDIRDFIEESIPEVTVDTEEVQNISLDKKEFEKGIKSVSYFCGQYSALKNVGVDNGSCIDIIISLMNSKHNLEMNKLSCDNNVEISKIQQIQMEKSRL